MALVVLITFFFICSTLGLCRAHGSMLGPRPMLAVCWTACWAYVGPMLGPCWPMLGLCLAMLSPSLATQPILGLYQKGGKTGFQSNTAYPDLKFHSYCNCFQFTHAHKNASAPSELADFLVDSLSHIQMSDSSNQAP